MIIAKRRRSIRSNQVGNPMLSLCKMSAVWSALREIESGRHMASDSDDRVAVQVPSDAAPSRSLSDLIDETNDRSSPRSDRTCLIWEVFRRRERGPMTFESLKLFPRVSSAADYGDCDQAKTGRLFRACMGALRHAATTCDRGRVIPWTRTVIRAGERCVFIRTRWNRGEEMARRLSRWSGARQQLSTVERMGNYIKFNCDGLEAVTQVSGTSRNSSIQQTGSAILRLDHKIIRRPITLHNRFERNSSCNS